MDTCIHIDNLLDELLALLKLEKIEENIFRGDSQDYGHIFTRDGLLIASTSQEGLIRYGSMSG